MKMIKNQYMSYIAVALEEVIQERTPPLTGAELARATGMQTAQISRIRNGLLNWVSPANLLAIAKAVAGDPKSKKFAQVHAKLLFARLMDEYSGPGARFITLKLHSECQQHEASAKSWPVLPQAIQADLDIIAVSVEKDRNIRNLIATTANLCRGKGVSQPNKEKI